jgi:hypothetical protein
MSMPPVRYVEMPGANRLYLGVPRIDQQFMGADIAGRDWQKLQGVSKKLTGAAAELDTFIPETEVTAGVLANSAKSVDSVRAKILKLLHRETPQNGRIARASSETQQGEGKPN